MTGSMPVTRLGPGGPMVSRIGLGLAALGRPAYITSGRDNDLPDRSVAAMRQRTFSVLDAAYAAGVRYVDAARSYGRAEEFLAGWLADRGHADVVVGSKWGYRYTGGWRLDAEHQEVKEHSLAMFTRQLAETRALLRGRLALYQVHSLTPDSGLLGDRALLAALARLRAEGVLIGLSTSGPGQADTLRRALAAQVDGQPLFSEAEVTWNLLEPSVAPAASEAAAAGLTILVKEVLANGRLALAGDAPRGEGPAGDAPRGAGPDGDGPGADGPGGDAPRGDGPGPPAPLAELAASRNVTADAVAIAAALAQPWADVVLSGAVTVQQLQANVAALAVGEVPPLNLAEPPAAYWAERAARPWR
jgi:aryl-alcohol dehydrogenase-like predicted oxidoreductase